MKVAKLLMFGDEDQKLYTNSHEKQKRTSERVRTTGSTQTNTEIALKTMKSQKDTEQQQRDACTEKADILLRDKFGRNCLDYAIDYEHEYVNNI